MDNLAYLSGVLKGDGWYCNHVLGLRVKDYDFSTSFALAINYFFNISVIPKQDERGYWLIRIKRSSGIFDQIINFVPKNSSEYASWLRGLFDSEGNANLYKSTRGKNCFGRRVSMYSTELDTLEAAFEYLSLLGIKSKIYQTKNSKNHIGSKTVFELRVKDGKLNYALFLNLIGSNITRKKHSLNLIVNSYVEDLSESCRQSQLRGAQSKRQKTIDITLPKVVIGVRKLIDSGIKPTQRACRIIPGYNSIQRFTPQAKLIEMAKDLNITD